MALASSVQESIWLKQFGYELDKSFGGPVTLFCDNQSAIDLANSDGYRQRTKHIDIRHHYLREKVADRTVVIKYISTDNMAADNLTKATMECSPYTLRIKTKEGQQTINLLSTDNVGTLKQKIAELSQISCNRLNILGGYPPKPLDLTDSTKSMSQIGVKNGDTLIVNEKHPDECTPSVSIEADTLLAQLLADEEMGATGNGLLMTQTVPSDNSCLFTSIGFVLKGKVDTSCHPMMREIIAQHVANDKESYNEAILGKPNDEYCAWIQKPETWGGAIEVSILSSHYGIEIDVVDVTSGVISRFGEDKDFGSRVFLLFDGIHYDALYLESSVDPVRTIFPVSDETIAVRAQQVAEEARSSRQFTDVNRFSLRCIQCNSLLVGQAEAQQHAKTTGHTNFGEV